MNPANRMTAPHISLATTTDTHRRTARLTNPATATDNPMPMSALTSGDLSALADYTGSGYQDLNNALRSDALDASQQARIDALNRALEKLPAYEGPVVRGTNLPPEVLDGYEPGEVITEPAFMSTTTRILP